MFCGYFYLHDLPTVRISRRTNDLEKKVYIFGSIAKFVSKSIIGGEIALGGESSGGDNGFVFFLRVVSHGDSC